MNIDRTNYEIWFIDWLDGNLSEEQVSELKQFLNGNKDLEEEFKELINNPLKLVLAQDDSFPGKEKLMRSVEDLPSTQFEYLCIAYLENDLSSNQKTELLEAIDNNPERKHIFELIQKTRLSLPHLAYKHKSLLIRRTPGQKIIRLTLVALSAAAIIAFVLMSHFMGPRSITGTRTNTANHIIPDSGSHKTVTSNIPAKVLAIDNSSKRPQKNENKTPGTENKNRKAGIAKPIDNFTPDSTTGIGDRNEFTPEKISVRPTTVADEITINNTLISNNLILSFPKYDDGRSRISRFIARTFREKILRENTSLDSPLKGYEIAEAGVEGLNFLLGWEMALKENNDEYGNLKSVYFSSKLLKFNAPAKKSESLP